MKIENIQTKKTRLKNIIKKASTIQVLTDAIERTNILTTYAYQFLRLWILKKVELNQQINPFTKETIKCVFKVFTKAHKLKIIKKPKKVVKPKLLNKANVDITNEFQTFYNDHFKELVGIFTVSGKNLSYILPCQASEMITNIENNIKMNFFNYVRRFVNTCFNQYTIEQLVNLTGKAKEDMENLLKCKLNTLKTDLLEEGEIKSEGYHLLWLNKYKPIIMPIKPINKLYHDDLQLNPYKYLPFMIAMNKVLEKKCLKQYQFFPLSTSYVKKYVTFEPTALVDLFMPNKNRYLADITGTKKEIYNTLFNMDERIFKPSTYIFDYIISTDGYSVSLQFRHKDTIEKNQTKKANITKAIKKTNKSRQTMNDEEIAVDVANKAQKKMAYKEEQLAKTREAKEKFKKLSKEEKAKVINDKKKLPKDAKTKAEFNKLNKVEFPYIDNLPKCITDDMLIKHKIYIDPGKRDIFKMMGDNGRYFTYSNKERQKETKSIAYRQKILNYKKLNGIIESETILSAFSTTTVSFIKFKDYIRNHINSSRIIRFKYKNNFLEKLKWFSYINKKRSEDRLLNKIEKVYTKDSIIIIGDWGISKQLRNFVSTPMISAKRILKKRFEVYTIDEHNTSIIHHKTEEPCKHLYLKTDKNNYRKIHAILTYKMENNRIGCINRDKNSVNNMKKITLSIINGNGRPQVYCRTNPLKKSVTNETVTPSIGASNSRRAVRKRTIIAI